MKIHRFFFYALCDALLFFHSAALFADRIKMLDGSVLYGKILKITPNKYVLQKTDGSEQGVPKAKIKRVDFTHRQNDIGYIDYFARLYWGLGSTAYSEEGIDQISDAGRPWSEGQNFSYFIPLRLGVETGWMLIPSTLAAHGGLEYNQTPFLEKNDLDYSYTSLTAGLSWYFSLYNFGINIDNFYIQPQVRLLLEGSVRSSSEDLVIGAAYNKTKKRST